MTLRLAFDNRKMLLAHVNARSELHGEERQAAGDLKFEARLSNEVLSELHPSLKSALYHLDSGKPADLVDQARVGEPGYLPHLKFPQLGGAFKWEGEMQGVTVIVTPEGGKAIELSGAKLNNVSFVALDGGTVELSFRVQSHPDEKQFGKLCGGMIQTEVAVSVVPQEEPAPPPIA